MTDVVARAKAASEGDEVDDRRHGFCEVCGEYVGDEDDQFGTAARSLIPELVAELERLTDLVDALRVGQGNLQVLLDDARAVADQGAEKP